MNLSQLHVTFMRALALAGALLAGLLSPCAHATGQITEYPLATPNSAPTGIARGPDGNFWFTEAGAGRIGRITPTGTISEFTIPLDSNISSSSPQEIVSGPDGNLWFTEVDSYTAVVGDVGPSRGVIGRITPAGVITRFPLAEGYSFSFGIANGPDGGIWFTDMNNDAVGRITPDGVITEYPLPNYGSILGGISAGPDGNLWFTEGTGIGRITPSGVITEYPFSVLYITAPGQITRGADGNLWFTAYTVLCGSCSNVASFIGRITPAGAISTFQLTSGSAPQGIASGPDGNLWFCEGSGQIGRITPAGDITEYATPTPFSAPSGIVSGADGSLWFTEANGNQIGKLAVSIGITAGFTGNWYDPAQSGHGFSIEVLPGNTLLAEWFVYAPNRGQAWIVGTGPIIGNTAQIQGYQKVGAGGRFPPKFDPSQLQDQFWGTLTFTFTDCNDGTVTWQPTAAGYTAGSIAISRLTMPAGLTCP